MAFLASDGTKGTKGAKGDASSAHAGGSDGSELSYALITSRDGTALGWDGSGAVADNATPGGWGAFKRMAPTPQAAVLDQELTALFNLDLSGATSGILMSLITADQPVATLHRPIVNAAFLADQLPHLRAYGDLRGDRLSEIETQTTDILSFFGTITYLSPEATPRTLEVLNACLRLTGLIEMRLKLHFDVPRPIKTSDELQPMIQTPGHGSWPSGHATESFVVATILTALQTGAVGGGAAAVGAHSQLMRRSARIAVNRTVAGVHYPIDSMSGAVLGMSLGEAVAALLDGAALVPTYKFDGTAFSGDFDLDRLAGQLSATETKVAVSKSPSSLLKHLWSAAKNEW